MIMRRTRIKVGRSWRPSSQVTAIAASSSHRHAQAPALSSGRVRRWTSPRSLPTITSAPRTCSHRTSPRTRPRKIGWPLLRLYRP